MNRFNRMGQSPYTEFRILPEYLVVHDKSKLFTAADFTTDDFIFA